MFKYQRAQACARGIERARATLKGSRMRRRMATMMPAMTPMT